MNIPVTHDLLQSREDGAPGGRHQPGPDFRMGIFDQLIQTLNYLMRWVLPFKTPLGKEWSPQLQLRKEHHLVTSGPYTRIRHPLHTAMIGFGMGIALVSANWVWISLAVLVVVGTYARVPREEKMMIEEFGEEYRAYMHRTGRFLPK